MGLWIYTFIHGAPIAEIQAFSNALILLYTFREHSPHLPTASSRGLAILYNISLWPQLRRPAAFPCALRHRLGSVIFLTALMFCTTESPRCLACASLSCASISGLSRWSTEASNCSGFGAT